MSGQINTLVAVISAGLNSEHLGHFLDLSGETVSYGRKFFECVQIQLCSCISITAAIKLIYTFIGAAEPWVNVL